MLMVNSKLVPPDSISNSEVKQLSADDSFLSESRTPSAPLLFLDLALQDTPNILVSCLVLQYFLPHSALTIH